MSARSSESVSYDVFLSYSRIDETTARQVHDELKQRGVRVFIDSLNQPGSNWVGALEYSIAPNCACALLVSEASNEFEWVRRERHLALATDEAGKRPKIIPVRLDSSDLPGFLKILQAIDFRPPLNAEKIESSMNQLASAILGRPVAHTALGVPSELRFLGFFPDGLVDGIYRWLIDARGLHTIAKSADDRGLAQTRDLDGVDITGLDLGELPRAFESLAHPSWRRTRRNIS